MDCAWGWDARFVNKPMFMREPHELLPDSCNVALKYAPLGRRGVDEILRKRGLRVRRIQDVFYFGEEVVDVLTAYQQAPQVVLVEAVRRVLFQVVAHAVLAVNVGHATTITGQWA